MTVRKLSQIKVDVLRALHGMYVQRGANWTVDLSELIVAVPQVPRGSLERSLELLHDEGLVDYEQYLGPDGLGGIHLTATGIEHVESHVVLAPMGKTVAAQHISISGGNVQIGSGNIQVLATSTAAMTQFAATQVQDALVAEDSAHARLWWMFHLTRICGGVTPAEWHELEVALAMARGGAGDIKNWSTGRHAHIGTTWWYPSGQRACIGTRWYYPNGQHACIGTRWYYPNGKHACIGTIWYFVAGGRAGSESAVLALGLGALRENERDLAIGGLSRLTGLTRMLAIVDLAWAAAGVGAPPG